MHKARECIASSPCTHNTHSHIHTGFAKTAYWVYTKSDTVPSSTHVAGTPMMKRFTQVFTTSHQPWNLQTCPHTNQIPENLSNRAVVLDLLKPPYRRSQKKATTCQPSHSIPKLSGRASEATWRDPEELKPGARHLRGSACGTSDAQNIVLWLSDPWTVDTTTSSPGFVPMLMLGFSRCSADVHRGRVLGDAPVRCSRDFAELLLAP